jgi:O-antigen/teichoic acid export membrane protein
MKEYRNFILLLLLFSLLFSAVLYFFIPALPEKFRYDEWWKVILFFMTATSAFHFGLLRSTQKRAASITIYYMASTTAKLLLYVGIMIVYSLLHKEKAAAFIATFFIAYFFYTIFEVGVLYKKFSVPVKKDPPEMQLPRNS